MTDFSRAGVKAIAADVQKALDKVAEDHGIKVTVGGGRYDPSAGTFKPKVEFSAPDSGKRQWDNFCRSYGLQEDDFGKTFKSGARTFRITGLLLKGQKFTVAADDVKTGKSFKFADAAIRRALGRSESAAFQDLTVEEI